MCGIFNQVRVYYKSSPTMWCGGEDYIVLVLSIVIIIQ